MTARIVLYSMHVHRYMFNRMEYSAILAWKIYNRGQTSARELNEALFFKDRLTYLHFNKGEEMAVGGTLLVRRLAAADPTRVFVGDVVVLKDPQNSDNYMVRRLAAIEGEEIVSKDEKEESFVLEKDQCWVLADNESLKPEEANDSRIFGPVSNTDIVGRAIYYLRTAADHGPVQNSPFGMKKDSSVMAIELNVEEMDSRS